MYEQLNCRIVAPDVSKLSRSEWLALRRNSLGGSDISSVLGLNRWRSPMEVWADKCGLPVANEMSEAALWGIRLEGLVRAELAHRNGWQIEKPTAMFQHRDIPYFSANVDGILDLPGKGLAVVEIKTASSYKESEWKNGQVPPEYMLQGQFYMSVLDVQHCIFGCLLGGQKLIVTEVARDDEMIHDIHRLAVDFWIHHVKSRIPPDPDGSESTAEFLSKLFPVATNAVPIIMTGQADVIIDSWQQAKAAEETAAEQKRLAESSLKAMLQENQQGISPNGWRVSWKEISTTRLDTAKIRAEEPSIMERYGNTTTSRRLSIVTK